MALDLSELIPLLAQLESEGRLYELDQLEFPETGVLRWLFGLKAGFYFANDGEAERRAGMIDLAERYYERTGGRCNFMETDEHSYRLTIRDDIRRNLSTDGDGELYRDVQQAFGFYIRHMNPSQMRSMDPVHDEFSCLLPGSLVPSGTLTYSTRLGLLEQDPAIVIDDFVTSCETLGVFYAVQGFAILANLNSGAQRDLYPVLRRFPGLLYEDPVGFSLEIEQRVDVIRDVNWLTAIDNLMLARIGGIEAARAQLSEAVRIHSFNGGVVFQAGPFPRIGDVNRGAVPPAYKEVNDMLRPLRFGDWLAPYLRVPRDVNAMEFTEEWVRRFD